MKIAFLMTFLFALSSPAQELVDRNYQALSKNQSLGEARREIQEKISQQVTEEFSRQILGDEKFARNRSLIMSKVIKSSARYIPFQKPGPVQTVPEGFSMAITMKVNPQVLRQVLQQHGLLNENESAPVLLPLIQVVDRVQLRSDRWWNTNPGDVSTSLRVLSRRLENSLRSSFSKSGFFVLRPVTSAMAEALPAPLRIEKHSAEDLKLLGEWFGVPLVIEGTLQISKPQEVSSSAVKLDLRLQVIQVNDNRPIADVSRSFETDPGPQEIVVERKLKDVTEGVMNDLASQVSEAWQKGAVGSSQLRLNLTQQLRLPEIEKFKRSLLGSSLGLRTVKERMISAAGVVFEVESPLSLEELAQKMNGLQIEGKPLRAQIIDSEIRVQWAR